MELSYNMILTRPFPKEKMRFLMVGLDGAGKSTILCQILKLKETVTMIPTMSKFLPFYTLSCMQSVKDLLL